ncbi:MAG: pyrroline-5-carboxylate reductase [Candidatus Omnitrophica bacterium]|nr:pyrroline-5-carboxylate reductase [Candidatus Omnitrophota bacterium]
MGSDPRGSDPIGVIGCGNMGAALIAGMVKSRFIRPGGIVVWDPDAAKLKRLPAGIRRARSNGDLAGRSRVILLAVKPQQMEPVLEEIRPHLQRRPLVISIAAGISSRWIEERLGGAVPVVRVMPNTAALVGKGIAALSPGRRATGSSLRVAGRIFRGVGEVVQVPERWMDAVTAVSGSGPAYFFFLMEQMITAGVRLGISRETARRLVLATAEGAAELARSSGEDPALLRGRVTSKGGTTEAAFKRFARAGLGPILQAGIRAAAERSKQLGR